MANRPPYDPPPPGGFDPRFGDRGVPPRGSAYGGRPIHSYDEEPAGLGRGERVDPFGRAPDPFDRRGAPPPPPLRRRPGMARSTKILLALGGLLLLGAILFGLSLTRAGPGADALETADKAKESAAADPQSRCAAPGTYEKIKRELFREAGTARGADLGLYDRLAGHAAIRVSEPLLVEENEAEERVSCSGTVALDLPPGVEIGGGRRSVAARISYSLQPAADGSGDVVTVNGAETLVRQLASLQRSGGAAAAAAGDTQPAQQAPFGQAFPEPAPAPAPADVQQPVPAPPPPPPPRPQQADPRPDGALAPTPPRPQASASPSFSCARASNRAERAICGDGGLAALDREMANRFFAARREANTTQRVLLDRTRGAFLAYRNRCGSDACIAGAYRDRIREINDIMADRWVAPR